MIGKIPDKRKDGKSSFRDLISYCTKKDPSEILHVGGRNLLSLETAALEMEALATDNKRCKDPVFHLILAWREMELPTNEQADEAVEVALEELGLSNCQALWALQNDTQNRHVHVVVNRVDPETKRAVIPANGWTYKAVEKAARRIELSQGWASEQSGFYSVDEYGKIAEKKRRDEPPISPSARDGEAHTAIKSAERIAQETAAPIIRNARNWEELHAKLAGQGIAFERKGSGAILRVGEVVVKASKAGRDISLSKLEARLGEYQALPQDIAVKSRQTEPIERVETRHVKNNWERYVAQREEYFRRKSEATAVIKTHQQEERAELQRKQKKAREGFSAQSWKGRGSLLNRQRSILAAAQQVEKLNLRDRQKKERDEMKKRFPIRFPNFKTWLAVVEEDQEAFVSFRYFQNSSLTKPDDAGTNTAPITVFDLRGFTPTLGNKGGVAYVTESGREAQFIDYGKHIVMSEKCGEMAILAALQLANQKWGSAEVNGTDEYKRTCVELAVRHNLKVSNPDLAKQAEERKKLRYETQRTQDATGKTTTRDNSALESSTNAKGFDRAYWIHCRDIMEKFKGRPMDYSRVDAIIGIRMRATDYTPEEVKAAIERNAQTMRRNNLTESEYDAKYGNRDWSKYAADTAEKYVFGPRGIFQYERALNYRPLYMRLEGRDPSKEQYELNDKKQQKGR